MLQLAFALETRTFQKALATEWINLLAGPHERQSSGQYHPVQHPPYKHPIEGHGEMKTSMQVIPARFSPPINYRTSWSTI